MANPVTRHVASHQARDPHFNLKARHYRTASFTPASVEAFPELPPGPVRVVYAGLVRNAMYGHEEEPVFYVYRTVESASLVGTYFARALYDFCL